MYIWEQKVKWQNIVNINDVKYTEWSMNEKYRGKSAEIAKDMGAEKLGFHVEILEPKSYSCPYHFHHLEEELLIAFEGHATLRQNNELTEIKPGDIIHFKPGPEAAHQVYNHTDQPFKFFALSTMDYSEVCEYPDSKKIFVSRLKKVFQQGKDVPYLTDEENPEKYWPTK